MTLEKFTLFSNLEIYLDVLTNEILTGENEENISENLSFEVFLYKFTTDLLQFVSCKFHLSDIHKNKFHLPM